MNTILDNKITLDRETHRYSLLDNPDIIFTSVTTAIILGFIIAVGYIYFDLKRIKKDE